MENKNKFTILALGLLVSLLNIFDGLATNYGYSYNFIEELNPLMNHILTISPELFLIFKFLFSILIIILSFAVYYKSNERFQRSFVMSLAGISVIYIGISIMHIYWLSYV
ncbi:DUF5658 family protein [Ureibacillus manganicus]|uniref:DUF5658 domain-containing protein n=1 Tax=Ureibacillus manganicus DSM 26584 TaxID=1384049 RepID=A0A0A3IAJ5_9BACL|nr:DUF5658 family protein [Ureibacillus manganicus]KGR79808.1 hypothetical protein CD29_04550 [Ureibacillus manganicus DSM 26584]